jgi:hypothetical protein
MIEVLNVVERELQGRVDVSVVQEQCSAKDSAKE